MPALVARSWYQYSYGRHGASLRVCYTDPKVRLRLPSENQSSVLQQSHQVDLFAKPSIPFGMVEVVKWRVPRMSPPHPAPDLPIGSDVQMPPTRPDFVH